jgi:hypothetical protein
MRAVTSISLREPKYVHSDLLLRRRSRDSQLRLPIHVQVLALVPPADVAARALYAHMPCTPLLRRRADETLTFMLHMVTNLCAGAGAGACCYQHIV